MLQMNYQNDIQNVIYMDSCGFGMIDFLVQGNH